MLRRGEQHDAARLADAERRLDVAREEQPLDAHEVGLVQASSSSTSAWIASSRSGSDRSALVVRQPWSTSRSRPPVAFDDPVAQRGGPRVDPEDLHPATSAKTSSGMSKLAVTR